jgi:hypothetical protein
MLAGSSRARSCTGRPHPTRRALHANGGQTCRRGRPGDDASHSYGPERPWRRTNWTEKLFTQLETAATITVNRLPRAPLPGKSAKPGIAPGAELRSGQKAPRRFSISLRLFPKQAAAGRSSIRTSLPAAVPTRQFSPWGRQELHLLARLLALTACIHTHSALVTNLLGKTR